MGKVSTSRRLYPQYLVLLPSNNNSKIILPNRFEAEVTRVIVLYSNQLVRVARMAESYLLYAQEEEKAECDEGDMGAQGGHVRDLHTCGGRETPGQTWKQ